MNNYPGMSLERFNQEYEGEPEWSVGRAQQPFIDIFSKKPPESPVLDIGCGTGDLARYVASLGCNVVGIDFSSKAIDIAKQHLDGGTVSARLAFELCDIFNINEVAPIYRTVLDCCFFHMLDDQAREQYALNVWNILRPEGTLHMLNIALDLPSSNTPRGITEKDIEDTFVQGWSIEKIETAPVKIASMTVCLPGTYACLKKI